MGLATLPEDREAARVLVDFGLVCGAHDGPPLHPDTDPRSIAASQLAAVRAAVRNRPRKGRPLAEWVAALSELVDLHVWNVRRKLADLGVIDRAEAGLKLADKKRAGDELFNRVADFLRRAGRWASIAEIVEGTGLARNRVRSVVAWEGNGFCYRNLPLRGRANKVRRVYQLASFKKARSA